MSEVKQIKCGCGRSPTGFCTGLHSMTNEQYKQYVQHIEEHKTKLNEQTKPQLLVD